MVSFDAGIVTRSFFTRLISRKLFIPRPAGNPNLNPLNCWLWGHALAVVIDENSENLNDLMDTVDSLCQILSEVEITNATSAIVR